MGRTCYHIRDSSARGNGRLNNTQLVFFYSFRGLHINHGRRSRSRGRVRRGRWHLHSMGNLMVYPPTNRLLGRRNGLLHLPHLKHVCCLRRRTQPGLRILLEWNKTDRILRPAHDKRNADHRSTEMRLIPPSLAS